MKIKKILALLLAAIMLCGLFAVVPATAAESEVDSLFEAYEADKHPGWWQPATKDGYDGFISVNSAYAVSTKQAYDMETNKVVISDFNTNSGFTTDNIAEGGTHAALVMFAPAAATGPYTFYHNPDETSSVAYEDSDALILSFKENENSGNVRISTLANFSDSTQGTTGTDIKKVCGEYGFDFTVPSADTYEISFSKKVVKDSVVDEETGRLTKAEYLYLLRINDYYITGDENSRLAKLYNSGTVSNAIVSFSAQNLFEGNVSIEKEDTFIASNGRTSTMKGDNADGSQRVFVQNENTYHLYGGEVATSAKQDLTKDMFTIKNIEWYNSTASTILVNFSSKNRYGEISKGSYSDEDESVLGFRIQKYHATTYTTSFSTADTVGPGSEAWNGSNHTSTKTDIGLPTEIKISFLEENGKGYMIINNRCVTNDYVSAFVTSGAAEDCYISVSAYISATIDVSIEEQDIDWAATYVANSFNSLGRDSEGNTIYFNHYKTGVGSYNKFNFDENYIDLYNISQEVHSATQDDAHVRLVTSFSTGHLFTDVSGSGTDLANGRLTLAIFFENDGLWVQHNMNVTTPSESSNLAKVPLSDDGYKIAVRKIDGKHVIYINDTAVTSDNITNYFASNYDSTYVTFSTRNKKMYYSADIVNYEEGSELSLDMEPEIVDNTIVNVQSFSIVESIKVNEAEGYTVSVTDKNGNALADDEFIASGDKITISYKDWFVVASYDLVVLADTNGDRDINGSDIINIQKELLGVGEDGIYTDALDVKYDKAFNILDFIAIKKLIAD